MFYVASFSICYYNDARTCVGTSFFMMAIIIECFQLNRQENASQNPFYGVKQHLTERLTQLAVKTIG